MSRIFGFAVGAIWLLFTLLAFRYSAAGWSAGYSDLGVLVGRHRRVARDRFSRGLRGYRAPSAPGAGEVRGVAPGLDPYPTKIVCVGKNYRDHVRELGGDVPAEPLIFLKPLSSLIESGEEILVPPGAGRIDFEGEIAFQVGKRARRVREKDALEHVSAILALNDVTARDLQRVDGQWTRAKGFDTFCPVGQPVPLEGVDLSALRVQTRVNGELKQDGAFADAVFQIPALLSFISRVMTLEPGDLIATGTPSGIGPIVPWDEVEVSIPGVGDVKNPVRSGSGEPWSYAVGPSGG